MIDTSFGTVDTAVNKADVDVDTTDVKVDTTDSAVNTADEIGRRAIPCACFTEFAKWVVLNRRTR